jgi:hypothetical protein
MFHSYELKKAQSFNQRVQITMLYRVYTEMHIPMLRGIAVVYIGIAFAYKIDLLLKHMQGSKTVNPNSQQQIPFLLGNWLS